MEDNFLTNHIEIANHVVNHFNNLFNSSFILLDNELIEYVIPNLSSKDINHLLTILPNVVETQYVAFALKPNSAPEPDGFSCGFFQKYMDIIKDDVVNDVLEFFSTNWILSNLNSNSIVLIPKKDNVDTMD